MKVIVRGMEVQTEILALIRKYTGLKKEALVKGIEIYGNSDLITFKVNAEILDKDK